MSYYEDRERERVVIAVGAVAFVVVLALVCVMFSPAHPCTGKTCPAGLTPVLSREAKCVCMVAAK